MRGLGGQKEMSEERLRESKGRGNGGGGVMGKDTGKKQPGAKGKGPGGLEDAPWLATLTWGGSPDIHTCGGWPWGSWGMSQEYSSSRSTLTIMASVCVKLLTRPESRPVRDRA